MFVNNEITERGLLPQGAGEGVPRGHHGRARGLGALHRRRDQGRHGPSTITRRQLTHPAVVLSAAPALSTVAAELRNPETTVSRETLDAVRSFMTNGIDSPLYGRDPLAARRGADDLQRVVGSGASVPRVRAAAYAEAV